MATVIPSQVLDERRLAAVHASGLLDSAPDEAFDRLARLAALLLEAPFTFVTIVDDKRSYWKSVVGDGVEARQNRAEESFCQYVIESDDRLIVGDTRAHERTRHNPSIESMGVAAWAGFPLHGPGGAVLGSFCVVDTKVRDWTERDVVVLGTLAEAAAAQVELLDALARAERHAAEVVTAAERSAALAQTLRESLLPPHLPDVPGVELAAAYLPAGQGEVLGDFYDVFQLDAGSWVVVLGDVSGNGVPAAKVTALARHTIRAAAVNHRAPSAILASLNRALLTQRPHGEEGFLTAACVVLRQTSQGATATLCSAGHTPVLVRAASGAVRQSRERGIVLGLFPAVDLVDEDLFLSPGDLLLLYSDGVTEARGPDGPFGDEQLEATLAAGTGTGAAATVAAIESAVVAFADRNRSDDIAVLALRVLPAGPT